MDKRQKAIYINLLGTLPNFNKLKKMVTKCSLITKTINLNELKRCYNFFLNNSLAETPKILESNLEIIEEVVGF